METAGWATAGRHLGCTRTRQSVGSGETQRQGYPFGGQAIRDRRVSWVSELVGSLVGWMTANGPGRQKLPGAVSNQLAIQPASSPRPQDVTRTWSGDVRFTAIEPPSGTQP